VSAKACKHKRVTRWRNAETGKLGPWYCDKCMEQFAPLKLFVQHDPSKAIGNVISIDDTPHGIEFTVEKGEWWPWPKANGTKRWRQP